MEKKAPYKTRQTQQLLDYLQTMPGRHMTATELCGALAARGTPVGKVTVYRQLERLVEQGLVTRYTVDGSTAACYAYTGAPDAAEEACYHCKCERCGALIHLHCDEVEHLRRHMQEHHGFAMDPARTVFYGLCETCRKAEQL